MRNSETYNQHFVPFGGAPPLQKACEFASVAYDSLLKLSRSQRFRRPSLSAPFAVLLIG